MSNGEFIVWGSVGGEIVGRFPYTDASERLHALERARQRKSDAKTGRGSHGAWGKRIGIAEMMYDADFKLLRRRAVK